jgi:glucan-binding YG repeat protein
VNQDPKQEPNLMEATSMKALGVISTTALFLLLGAAVPAFAQEEHHEEEAKPAKQQEQAKPAKQEEAKPAKQEEARPAKQEEAKPAKQQEQAKTEKQQQEAKPVKQEEAKPAKQQQQAREQANDHAQKSQGQYAHDGQKDSHGHVYTASRFGPDHHARFVESGGRLYNGRREYSYGGYWFYAGSYPAWFYQQDVYFIMGADGIWYAVAINDPSLTFVVNIG